MNQTNEIDKVNNNLPAVIGNEKFISKLEKEHPRLVNSLKRTGKVALYSLGGLSFLTISAASAVFAAPMAATYAGLTCALGMFFKAGVNTVFQNEDDLLFTARRGITDNDLKLFQRIDVFNKVKGLDKAQLAGLMTINTLVGLERYKSFINTSKFTNEDGKKIYDQKFSTKTHGINIKNFKLLDKLGYVKIDDISDVQGRSSLLIEKIAFRNYEGIKDHFKLLLSGDKEKIEKNKVDMRTIKFRLTDKKIDLIEMYKDYTECKSSKKQVGRVASALFDKRMGILAPNLSCSKVYSGKKGQLNSVRNGNKEAKEESKLDKKTLRLRKPRKVDISKKIGIEYDSLGRPYINYKAKQSGVEMLDAIFMTSVQEEKRQDFKQSLEAKDKVKIDKEKIEILEEDKKIVKDEEREIS